MPHNAACQDCRKLSRMCGACKKFIFTTQLEVVQTMDFLLRSPALPIQSLVSIHCQVNRVFCAGFVGHCTAVSKLQGLLRGVALVVVKVQIVV